MTLIETSHTFDYSTQALHYLKNVFMGIMFFWHRYYGCEKNNILTSYHVPKLWYRENAQKHKLHKNQSNVTI